MLQWMDGFGYDVPQLVNQAQLTAIVPRNVLSGFEHTGNWPYNPNIFTDADFAPSSVTDRSYLSPDDDNDENCISNPSGTVSISQLAEATNSTVAASTACMPNPSTPSSLNAENEVAGPSCNPPSTSYISPSDIRPFPKPSPRKKKQRQRRKGKTQIFTLTPIRNEVAAKEMKKVSRKKATSAKKLFKKKSLRKRKQPDEWDEISSDESIVIQYDDSEPSISDEEMYINVGDFVVVKVWHGINKVTLKLLYSLSLFSELGSSFFHE